VTARSVSRRRVASRASSRRRPPPRRTQIRRRRSVLALAGAIAVGVIGGLALSQLGSVEETLLEVTLPLRHDDIIRQQASEKQMDAALIAAVIYSESRFRDQTSHAGARGLMQVRPETALEIADHSGAEISPTRTSIFATGPSICESCWIATEATRSLRWPRTTPGRRRLTRGGDPSSMSTASSPMRRAATSTRSSPSGTSTATTMRETSA
jgi:hypothetical protein